MKYMKTIICIEVRIRVTIEDIYLHGNYINEGNNIARRSAQQLKSDIFIKILILITVKYQSSTYSNTIYIC